MEIEIITTKFCLTFNRDEGWTIVMALRDAYIKYPEAKERDKWLETANDLDRKLRSIT